MLAAIPNSTARPATTIRPDGFTYGLTDIMRRFGQSNHSPRWHIRYVSRLIGHYGFPKPFPLYHGDTASDDVKPQSRWDRASVDAWLDDRRGPAAAQVEAAAAREGADVMDHRAAALGQRAAGKAA